MFVCYHLWPVPLEGWQAWVDYGFWLVYFGFLVALFVYDLRWYLLPNKLVFPMMGLGVVHRVLEATVLGGDISEITPDMIWGLLIDGGFF